MSAEPIVEFIPPKFTLDETEIDVKENNLVDITTFVTVWSGEEPTYNYTIGDTYISRKGMEMYNENNMRIYGDVLAIKVYDLYVHEIIIEVGGETRIVDLNNYADLEIVEDSEYPDAGLWISV